MTEKGNVGSKTIHITNRKCLEKGVEHAELTLGVGIPATICYLAPRDILQ